MNQIKHRYTGAVLYEYDSGMTLRDALSKTTKNVNLQGADLRWADLQGAELYEAYIQGTDLYGVKLYGANLGKHGKLVGMRPFFQCGPIGSRSDYLLSFITDKGIVIKAGCFTGTLDEFRTAVEKTHGKSDHGNEYAMAMRMVEAHASLWVPKEATK